MDASRLICVLLKLHFEIGTAGTKAVPALLAGLGWTDWPSWWCPYEGYRDVWSYTSAVAGIIAVLQMSTFDFLLPNLKQDESSTTAVFAQWGLHPGDVLLAHLQV